MVIKSVGSLATDIYNRVENVSTAISGVLVSIVDDERLNVENYTGVSIGSTAIAEKYQPAILDLSLAKTLELMGIEGADVSSVSLGDFSLKQGADSNINATAKYYRDSGMEKLKILGRKIKFTRSIGGI